MNAKLDPIDLADSAQQDAVACNFSLTVLTATYGNASKRLIAGAEGQPVKDTKHGLAISRGAVEHKCVEGLAGLRALLKSVEPDQALVHGIPRDSQPGAQFTLVTAAEYSEEKQRDTITRTKEHFNYPPGARLIMFDVDPDQEAPTAINTAGELMAIIAALLPAFVGAGWLVTVSTSSAIRSKESGEWLKPPKGLHVYMLVTGKVDRIADILKARLWLAGHGYCKLASPNKQTGVAAVLERCLVDCSVFSPERLDYVAGAIIDPDAPFVQDRPEPEMQPGAVVDLDAITDLSAAEKQEYHSRVEAAKAALRPQREEKAAERIRQDKPDITDDELEREIHTRFERADDGVLAPDHLLHFSNGDVVAAGKVTAAMNLRALADPQEGPDYSRTSAKFWWNDGNPRINSLAHGTPKAYSIEGLSKPAADREPPPFEACAEAGDDPSKADDFDHILTELAKLSPIEYDRRRIKEAKKLGIRAPTLDKMLTGLRELPDDDKQGKALEFNDPEPWPDTVETGALLTELVTLFNRYIVLPSGAADAVALWVLHCWTHDTAVVSPVLTLSSPEKRCGKTTLLSLLCSVACRPLTTSNISTPALFRTTEKFRPTLLIDEADSFLKDNEDLRNIINSGHTKTGAYVVRTVGDDFEPRKFSTWAPKVIALIGNLHPTLIDRSIVIRMRRQTALEKAERLRLDRLHEFQEIPRRCIRWASDHIDTLTDADPETPTGLNDRAADNWRPLLAIADLAGADWAQRARAVVIEIAGYDDADDAAGVMLLQDIKALFDSRRIDRIASKDIAEYLATLEERPWPEWRGKPINTRAIARVLKPFGVKPETVRFGNETAKGYHREQFKDAFARYITPNLSVTPSQSSNHAGSSDFQSVTQKNHVTDESAANPLNEKTCYGVTDEIGVNTEEWEEIE